MHGTAAVQMLTVRTRRVWQSRLDVERVGRRLLRRK